MGGARALIASLGASISLVAGAALSLLVVSFVFAYDGLVGEVGETRAQAALRVQVLSPQARARNDTPRAAAPVVVRARAPRPAPAVRERPARRPIENGEQSNRTFKKGTPPPPPPPPPPPVAGPTPRDPTVGDGVRDLGAGLSGTVQNTGQALGQAAAPLGPPVTQAVQAVFDLVAALLQGATGALGGTVDALSGQR